MEPIDRNAPATLHEREDGGSDMHFHFRMLREGPVGELARHVASLSAEHRARLVLEVPGGRTLNVGEILELAAREDLGD